MLGTFLFLAAIGALSAAAWIPWWGLASMFGVGRVRSARTGPGVR